MNQSLVADWIKRVLQRHPGALLNLNSMLVLYSFWVHTLDQVKVMLKNSETDLAVISDGLTSLLLPLGVCIDQPLKAALREMYASSVADGGHECIPSRKIKLLDID